MRLYVTFGQDHTHRVVNQTLDKDCVAVVKCATYAHGRDICFEYFGDKFATTYTEKEIADKMDFFPRGKIPVN